MGDIVARFFADPAVSTILTAFVAGLIALWLLAAMWVHADASHRTGSELAALTAAGWVLLSTPFLLPLSLAAYAFVRPAEAVADRRVRGLTAAFVADSLVAASCSRCGSLVDGAWRRCPLCATWLAAPCAGCGSWSDVELGTCPWCGETGRAAPTVAEAMVLAGGPFVSPTPAPAGMLVPALASSAADRRPSHAGRDRLAAARDGARADGARAGRRPRPSRAWHRRAPGSADARSPERGSSGGSTGARSRS